MAKATVIVPGVKVNAWGEQSQTAGTRPKIENPKTPLALPLENPPSSTPPLTLTAPRPPSPILVEPKTLSLRLPSPTPISQPVKSEVAEIKIVSVYAQAIKNFAAEKNISFSVVDAKNGTPVTFVVPKDKELEVRKKYQNLLLSPTTPASASKEPKGPKNQDMDGKKELVKNDDAKKEALKKEPKKPDQKDPSSVIHSSGPAISGRAENNYCLWYCIGYQSAGGECSVGDCCCGIPGGIGDCCSALGSCLSDCCCEPLKKLSDCNCDGCDCGDCGDCGDC